MIYRPTYLNLFIDCCPRALDYAEAGRPYSREVFATGITAHAVAELVGAHQAKIERVVTQAEARSIAEKVYLQLVSEGRRWSGEHEPPLPPAQAREGVEIALAWLEARPLPTSGVVELALAFDAEWRPVAYDSPAARFRTILDRVDQYETMDAWGNRVVVARVTDLKTSYRDGAARLEHLQQRAQAVCLYYSGLLERYGADTIEICVENLRMQRGFNALIPPEALDETILSWRRELEALMKAADVVEWSPGGAEGQRQARPGIPCMGCPYLLGCEPARELMEAEGLSADPSDVARRYAVTTALREALAARLKVAAKDSPIEIDGGVVGYVPKIKRRPAAAAVPQLVEAWLAKGGELSEMIRVAKPGVTAIDNIVRRLAPRNKTAQRELAEGLFESVTGVVFGIHRRDEPDEDMPPEEGDE